MKATEGSPRAQLLSCSCLRKGQPKIRAQAGPKGPLWTPQPAFLELGFRCPLGGGSHQQNFPASQGLGWLLGTHSPKNPSSWAVASKNRNSCSA